MTEPGQTPVLASLARAIRSLRDMTWFDEERCRVYAAACGVVFVGVVLGAIWRTGGRFDDGMPLGGDFSSFWAASRLIWAGLPAGAYVPPLHKLAETVILPPHVYEAFFYPPPYLIICLPFGRLPYFGALTVFLTATGALYAAAIYHAAPSARIVIVALAYPAVIANLGAGQNGMITAAIIGGGLTLMDRRPKLAGMILGLMVMKPHLALAVPVALALSGRWKQFAWAALSAAGLIAVSVLLFGWDVWSAFLANLHDARRVLEDGLVGFQKFQSAFGVARNLGFSATTAYAAQGISASFALAVLVWMTARGVSPAIERSLIVLASLLMTPFVLSYDFVVSAFPLVWLLVEWSERGFPPWGRLVLMVAYVVPLPAMALSSAHLDLFSVLGLVAYLIWVTARGNLLSGVASTPIPAEM